jgi:chromosome segregation ATPase
MATAAERISVVETKVENLNEKLDELKIDVKDMHECLDNTRDGLTTKLDQMYEASCSQHEALAKEITNIKSQRDRLIWMFSGIIAAGGFFAGHADKILKILGG